MPLLMQLPPAQSWLTATILCVGRSRGRIEARAAGIHTSTGNNRVARRGRHAIRVEKQGITLLLHVHAQSRHRWMGVIFYAVCTRRCHHQAPLSRCGVICGE
jgi:hypothetical protein